MPPKARITQQMVIEAGIKVVREQGYENVNARTVAKELDCSTQPVMYHFPTMEELKRAVYSAADEYHTGCLMDIREDMDVMLQIGISYIRFAVEEPNLFRFLFQSGYAEGGSIVELIDAPMLEPVILAMQQEMQLSIEQTKEVFLILAMFVHGYASLIANNSLEFDEAAAAQLEKVYNGAILAQREEM